MPPGRGRSAAASRGCGPLPCPPWNQSRRRQIALSVPMIFNSVFSPSNQKHFLFVQVVFSHFALRGPSTQGSHISSRLFSSHLYLQLFLLPSI